MTKEEREQFYTNRKAFLKFNGREDEISKERFDTMEGMLLKSFYWRKTPQDHKGWSSIATKYKEAIPQTQTLVNQ